MEAPWVNPVTSVIMRLLQPPPSNHRFDDQSERDLLIRLSVKMEHLQRTVYALVWAVGIMLAGIVPFSLVMAFYAGILWILWRGGP